MNRNSLFNCYKATLIVFGAVCFGYAVFFLPEIAYSWGYLLLLAFSVLISPRLSLILLRSKFSVNFSDSFIFLCFLIYGGEAAIIAATLEMVANCFYIKRKNLLVFGRYMILTNTFITTISITVAYFVWMHTTFLTGIQPASPNTSQLIASLGILAVTHFVVSTFFECRNSGV